jgi:glycosyltransferase involved in cell wall biosynthesis
MHPFVSVVMATYQGEKYLKLQIESLLAQDYPNLEFIWVDDASTDQSLSILKEYACQDTRICILENRVNEGHNAAFEKGMMAAKGDYIALSDQDDVWVSSKISMLIKGIGNCSLVYSDSQLIDQSGRELPIKMSNLKRQIPYNSPLMYTFGAWAPGHTMLFKKDLLETALPLSNWVTHDYLLGFSATCHEGIAYIPISLVHYRQHESNAIGADLKKAKKLYQTRAERKLRICERVKLLADRCGESKEKQLFEQLYLDFSGNSLVNRLRRFKTVLKYREDMLAYKGKSPLGNFLYCFKLLFGIY